MRKLSLSLILVVVVSIITLGWLLNKIYLNTHGSNQRYSAYYAYLELSDDLHASLADTPLREDFINVWNAHSDMQLALLPREDFPLPQTLEESFNRGERLLLESDQGIAAHYTLDDGLEVLAISLPADAIVVDQGKLELILTLSFYGGVTAIILIWVWPLIHRLISLRNTARRFGKGDLAARVKLRGVSYIREIETEFNRMADRIESLLNDNKLLTRAVSHDLKTPLARLRFGLEALTETTEEKQRAKYAVRVNRDMEEMESLINTLLQYARLDENRIEMQNERFELSHLISSLVETYQHDNLQISFKNDGKDLVTFCDQRYLSMLINNLLSNAVRYAQHEVRVTAHTAKQRIQVCIEDDGAGINSEEVAHVTKPFWRGEQGKHRKGHGMGLAIVSRIADWLGADFHIGRSSALGGAAIHFSLPLDENP
ncbi:signal transduction histidine kinase [Alteromonadaceae bacterium 2753L.S.0a.02]|nr:signal transduction histidine kinase [Alteromonadaceae bacterium 2753L.S.0a.02]